MLRVIKTITACFALFLCTPALGQEGQIPFHIECDTAHFHYIDYIDSLSHYENKMGEKKHLNTSDKKLTLAFYVALSHYPELHDKRISLRLKPLVSTMQAQPSPNFIIKRKSKRSYRIYVNDNPELTGINYQDLSFNALVGWIGHEFAHLIDYASMNLLKNMLCLCALVIS